MGDRRDVRTLAMRTVFVLALVFASIVAIRAEDAPPADAADEMTGDPDKDGAKEMAEMDTNKDGKATAEEIRAFMKARYYSKPEDLKDIQNDEGKPATPDDITKMIEKDAKELLDELDKDKSGDLSLQEVIAQYKDDEGVDDEATPEEDEAGDEGEGEAGEDEGSDKP